MEQRRPEQDSPIDPLNLGPDDTVRQRIFCVPEKPEDHRVDRSQRRKTFCSRQSQAVQIDIVTCFRVEFTEVCRSFMSALQKAGSEPIIQGLPPGHELGTHEHWAVWLFAFSTMENEEIKDLLEIIDNENDAEICLGVLFRTSVQPYPPRSAGNEIEWPTSSELAYVRTIVIDCRVSAGNTVGRYEEAMQKEERPPQLPQPPERSPSPYPEPSLPARAAAKKNRLTLPPSYSDFPDTELSSPLSPSISVKPPPARPPPVRFEPQRRSATQVPTPESAQRGILAYISSVTMKPQAVHSTTLWSFARFLNPFRFGSNSRASTSASASQAVSGQASPAVDLGAAFSPYIPPPPVQPSGSGGPKSVSMRRDTAEAFSSAEGWSNDFRPLFVGHRCNSFRLATTNPIPLDFWCNDEDEESNEPCSSHIAMNLSISDLVFTPRETLYLTRAGPEAMSAMVGEKFKRSLRLS